MRLRYLMLLLLPALLATPAFATTHVVNVNGGADFTGIAPAVGACSEGDTILVRPGLYTGPDNQWIGGHGTNIVFIADTDGREPVIVDGSDTTTVFYFNSGQDATTIVRGFTIQNGYAQGGAGMRITYSSPTIENCTFLNNHAFARGGAMYLAASSSVVFDCVFRGNSAVTAGGAIYSSVGSSTTIVDGLFDENDVPTPSLGGGAIYCGDGSETIAYSTIVENGDDQVKIVNGSGVDIAFCIVADGTEGVGVTSNPTDGAWVDRSILFGNAGGDVPESDHSDINYDDPLFCDAESDDYFLCEDSFADPSNNPWGIQLGAYVTGCEPCGSPVEVTTWGAVKAMFR